MFVYVEVRGLLTEVGSLLPACGLVIELRLPGFAASALPAEPSLWPKMNFTVGQ